MMYNVLWWYKSMIFFRKISVVILWVLDKALWFMTVKVLLGCMIYLYIRLTIWNSFMLCRSHYLDRDVTSHLCTSLAEKGCWKEDGWEIVFKVDLGLVCFWIMVNAFFRCSFHLLEEFWPGGLRAKGFLVAFGVWFLQLVGLDVWFWGGLVIFLVREDGRPCIENSGHKVKLLEKLNII